MDGGAWWAAVHGVTKSQTQLSDFTFTFHFHALEKEMATHSSVLAWRIPGMGEPGGLPSMRLHRVGHDWSDLASCSDYSHIKPPPRNFSLLIYPGCQVGRKQVHFRSLNQRAQVLTISGSFQPPGPATGTIIFWLEDVQSKVFLILSQES